jgi:hypothetical protein
MAQKTDTPFQAGGTVQNFPPVPHNKKLVVRIESGGTFKVIIKRNGTPSATAGEFFLDSGDAVELVGGYTYYVLNTVGDPLIFWAIE